MLKDFGEEYSRVRIFKGLKKCLEQMYEICQVDEAKQILEFKEYDLEILKQRPNT